MMKWIPIKAVATRTGLSYTEIELDPILKVIKMDGRDYCLSASLVAWKRHKRQLAARPSKVHGHGGVTRMFRVFGASRVLKEEERESYA